MPVAIAIVSDFYGQERRALALGIIGAVTEAGGVLGPLYGALIVQHLGWWGPSWTPFVKKLGDAIGYGVCGAFITIPIAVMAGMVHP